jgi:hypothetical protein
VHEPPECAVGEVGGEGEAELMIGEERLAVLGLGKGHSLVVGEEGLVSTGTFADGARPTVTLAMGAGGDRSGIDVVEGPAGEQGPDPAEPAVGPPRRNSPAIAADASATNNPASTVGVMDHRNHAGRRRFPITSLHTSLRTDLLRAPANKGEEPARSRSEVRTRAHRADARRSPKKGAPA